MSPEHDGRSVSIVIPTYRRPDALQRTLAGVAMLEQPAGGMEVVVVDNAADPATETVVLGSSSRGLNTRLVRESQRGAARARNEGARHSTGEYLLFLDDDMVPSDRDMIGLHLSTHWRHARALVAGRWTYLPEVLAVFSSTPFGRWRLDLERRWETEREGTTMDGECVEALTLPACNLSIARELFWSLGGFDEQYPYAGAEDQDFSTRAVGAGCALILNKAIHVHHNETWMDFEHFCLRQELGAHSVVHLARTFPERLTAGDFYRENWPTSAEDPPCRIVKKLLKSSLSWSVPLAVLRRGVRAAERGRLPEGFLRRLYSAVVGLHIFRGVRQALAEDQARTTCV